MAYSIIETCIGCTACTKRCPTNAISGDRNELHVIDPSLCIDCGACGTVCPPEAILDAVNDACEALKKTEWPKAVVIEEKCIGSGCELCINICPFDALSLEYNERVDDFFGVSTVDEKKMHWMPPLRRCLWLGCGAYFPTQRRDAEINRSPYRPRNTTHTTGKKRAKRN